MLPPTMTGVVVVQLNLTARRSEEDAGRIHFFCPRGRGSVALVGIAFVALTASIEREIVISRRPPNAGQ